MKGNPTVEPLVTDQTTFWTDGFMIFHETMGQNTGSTLVSEKSLNFAMPSVVPPQKDVLETSAEIPY